MKDITVEIFGTKGNVVKEASKVGKASKIEKVVENNGLEIPEGFEPINPPTATVVRAVESKEPIIPAEVVFRQKELDTLFRDVTKNFLKIGFHLLHFKETREYKVLGFSRFEDFVKAEYNLSKSTAYNFIKVCVKYSVKDEDGKPTKVLGKEYQKYNSSQLVAMLNMNEDAIAQVDPDKTIKEINKELKDSRNYDGEFDSDSDNYDTSDDSGSDADGKPKKKNVRDLTIPVMRLSMAKGQTWDEVTTVKVRKACEQFLTDEKRQADDNDYTIEICISYPDKSAI